MENAKEQLNNQEPTRKSSGKNILKRIARAIRERAETVQRRHHRAVDYLNNYQASYYSMKRQDRLRWTLKNPLARMLASSKVEDTRRRMAQQAEDDALADRMRAENAGRRAAGPEPLDRGVEVPQGRDPQQAAAQGNKPQPGKAPSKTAARTADTATAGIAGGIWQGGVVPQATRAAAHSLGAGTASLEMIGRIADHSAMVLRAVGHTAGAISNGLAIRSARATGQSGQAKAQALSMVSNIGNASAFAIKGAAYLSGSAALNMAAGKLVPGINMVAGGFQSAAGIVTVKGASRTMQAMKQRMEAMNAKEGRSMDEELVFRLARQAKGAASIRAVAGSLNVASGALKAAGGAATLSGAAAPVGAALSGMAAALDVAGKVVTEKKTKTLRTEVVNEAMNLEGKIKELMDEKGFDRHRAKHVALKSMGFQSGKRREAFERITTARASWLHEAANANKGGMAGFVRDMGLRARGGQFSLQGIGLMLGMQKGVPLHLQAERTAHSRDNPFQKIMDARQEKQDRIEAKKRMKTEARDQKQKARQEKKMQKTAAKPTARVR